MKCVACHSNLGSPLAKIGNQFPSAIFLKGKTESALGLEKTSLDLSICPNNNCKLVQLSEPMNLDVVYKNYPYQTSTTATMREALSSVVSEVLSFVNLEPGDVVLDIGGNDGTLLSLFDDKTIFKVNIDPAANVDQIVSGSDYVYINEVFNSENYFSNVERKPKIIFSTAMFYQLHNPKAFINEVDRIMDSNSLFCLQFAYLGSMYKSNIFDNVVHEHITYFSLYSLERLLIETNLTVVGARIVDTYGGSLRVFISKKDSDLYFEKCKSDLDLIREQEYSSRTNIDDELISFGNRFEKWKREFRSVMDEIFDNHGPIQAIGASTKGNMILQSIGLSTREISVIHDNNLKKIGTVTTGTNIPIVSEDLEQVKDKYFLILPYYYLDFFASLFRQSLRSREKSYLIVPLPQPRILVVEGVD